MYILSDISLFINYLRYNDFMIITYYKNGLNQIHSCFQIIPVFGLIIGKKGFTIF